MQRRRRRLTPPALGATVRGGCSPGTPRFAATENEQRAERIASVLDKPFTIAGVAFVAVVIADLATPTSSSLSPLWTWLSWLLWLLFVIEFLLRMVIARSTGRFLRRNWWQIIFLALPFLRFLRAFSRTARFARLASSSLRTRSAASKLGSRIGWLASVTLMICLLGSQIVSDASSTISFGDALRVAVLATVAGEPIDDGRGWLRVAEVVMVLWSTVGFAALAGTIGAFLVERTSAVTRDALAPDVELASPSEN